MPLTFAYGSNMDIAAMASRCPGSRLLGPARLPRHRLVITPAGYASVVRDPRRTVWGLLWDLALGDGAALDRYEDVAGGLYRKLVQPVPTEAGPRCALVYVGRGEGGVPRPGYFEGVVGAARAAGLPQDYIREIEALLPYGREAGSSPPRPGRSVRPTRVAPPMPASGGRGGSWTS